jgi:hypothetical protein
MYLCSQSVSPIVSLFFPPCHSVSTFVGQLTFLSHLIPRSEHTGDPARATKVPTSQQVRVVRLDSVPGVAAARFGVASAPSLDAERSGVASAPASAPGVAVACPGLASASGGVR